MLPFHGKYPKLDPKSCVMPGAELAGDVELKEYASIWQNCALRGDVNKIVVGRYSNVTFYDAEYAKYGMGATEVYIYQKAK